MTGNEVMWAGSWECDTCETAGPEQLWDDEVAPSDADHDDDAEGVTV